MHWPFTNTVLPEISISLHELANEGACFGEVGGYERANWFAKNGAKAEYDWL